MIAALMIKEKQEDEKKKLGVQITIMSSLTEEMMMNGEMMIVETIFVDLKKKEEINTKAVLQPFLFI